MELREWTRTFVGVLTAAMADLNARHPWSHNDHFHSGRFLAVGLAPPRSLMDHAWDLASMVTNPMIGYVKHPWPSSATDEPPPFPVRDATLPFGEVREVVHAAMPGAAMRHRIGFRHTIAWTKPG
jgi:hypothetical protein